MNHPSPSDSILHNLAPSGNTSTITQHVARSCTIWHHPKPSCTIWCHLAPSNRIKQPSRKIPNHLALSLHPILAFSTILHHSGLFCTVQHYPVPGYTTACYHAISHKIWHNLAHLHHLAPSWLFRSILHNMTQFYAILHLWPLGHLAPCFTKLFQTAGTENEEALSPNSRRSTSTS